MSEAGKNGGGAAVADGPDVAEKSGDTAPKSHQEFAQFQAKFPTLAKVAGLKRAYTDPKVASGNFKVVPVRSAYEALGLIQSGHRILVEALESAAGPDPLPEGEVSQAYYDVVNRVVEQILILDQALVGLGLSSPIDADNLSADAARYGDALADFEARRRGPSSLRDLLSKLHGASSLDELLRQTRDIHGED